MERLLCAHDPCAQRRGDPASTLPDSLPERSFAISAAGFAARIAMIRAARDVA
jgi:hypothetical protein